MCGIAGIVAVGGGAAAPDRGALERMARAMAHRGPDGEGVLVAGSVGLAHARLAIIDPASGAQPMAVEGGRFSVAYNGEIFNHVELRAELEARGRRFLTTSDTEVLLHAWAEWGEAALARFDGQFAFALFDAGTKTLVLARDRLGVRPLHLAEHEGRLLFASEVKALFAAEPRLPRTLDLGALAETFTFWTPVAPRTAFTAVRELPPAHLRRIDVTTGASEERAWWALRPGPRLAPDADVEGAVREALEDAVRLRLVRADVPVGAYLSGGLDSSLVTALARRHARHLDTFSVRFEDAEYDETPFQRAVATALETRHHELVVSKLDVARAFPDLVTHAERPVLRTAGAPLFLLAREVRAHGTKVVLTGEGADEMFAGYDLFREARVRRFWARQPGSRFRPALLDRLYPWTARSPVAQRAFALRFFGKDLARHREPGFGHLPRWSSASSLLRLLAEDVRAEVAAFDPVHELTARFPSDLPSWSPLSQDQWIETTTLLSGYLLAAQGDRVSLAHGVEGRFPFLAKEVVALAWRLRDASKLRVLDEKHVLKRIAEKLLPREVASRTKQPYRAPDAAAFAAATRTEPWIDELLSPGAVRRVGLFDPDLVTRLWSKVRARALTERVSNTDDMAVVGVLSTQLLHERFAR